MYGRSRRRRELHDRDPPPAATSVVTPSTMSCPMRRPSFGGPARRYTSPKPGSTRNACSSLARNANPTSTPASTSQRVFPPSSARVIAYAAPTSRRTSSESGLLKRNISAATGVSAATGPATSAAPGENQRLTVGVEDADDRDALERLGHEDRPRAHAEDPRRDRHRPDRHRRLVDGDEVRRVGRAEEERLPALRPRLHRGGVVRVRPARRAEPPEVEDGRGHEQGEQRGAGPRPGRPRDRARGAGPGTRRGGASDASRGSGRGRRQFGGRWDQGRAGHGGFDPRVDGAVTAQAVSGGVAGRRTGTAATAIHVTTSTASCRPKPPPATPTTSKAALVSSEGAEVDRAGGTPPRASGTDRESGVRPRVARRRSRSAPARSRRSPRARSTSAGRSRARPPCSPCRSPAKLTSRRPKSSSRGRRAVAPSSRFPRPAANVRAMRAVPRRSSSAVRATCTRLSASSIQSTGTSWIRRPLCSASTRSSVSKNQPSSSTAGRSRSRDVGAHRLEAALRVAHPGREHRAQDQVVGARDELTLRRAGDRRPGSEPRSDREVRVAGQERCDEREEGVEVGREVDVHVRDDRRVRRGPGRCAARARGPCGRDGAR